MPIVASAQAGGDPELFDDLLSRTQAIGWIVDSNSRYPPCLASFHLNKPLFSGSERTYPVTIGDRQGPLL